MATLIHITLCMVFTAFVFFESFGGTFLETLEKCIIPMVLFCFSLFFFFSLAFLVGYHCSLSRRGLTTNEDIKQLYNQNCDRPFRPGNLCFRSTAPSLSRKKYLSCGWKELMALQSNSGM